MADIMRRDLLGIAPAALAGGVLLRGAGGTPPAPAGYQAPSASGVAAGSSSGIVRARQVIIAGPFGQMLIYSASPPALGNLIESHTGAAGVDQVGNAFLAGATTYTFRSIPANHYVATNIQGTTIGIYTSTTEAGPWTQIADISYKQFSSSGLSGLYIDGSNGTSLFFPESPATPAVQVTGGYLAATDPSGTTEEGWHVIPAGSFLNGWLATANTPRYKITPDRFLCFDGSINGNGATAATFFTLPAQWRPDPTTILSRIMPAGANAGVIAGQAPFISINGSTGSCATGGVTPGTAGMSVTITGRVPLD